MVRILIVEDQPEILELMVDGISFVGYEVITAQDGEEAWLMIERGDPDIILLDLMMPKMGGFSVLEKLRKSPPSKKWQPVIIISALHELKHMKKGFALEADHYIAKPWEMPDILKGIKMMEKLIPQRKSSSEMQREDEER